MVNIYTDEDKGWKVNIIQNTEEPQNELEETASKIVWSRKKKIGVLLVMIVLTICVCMGLVWYIKDLKDIKNDGFTRLIEAGAYGYAYSEYIKTDEDVDKYSEFINDYYDELVKEYNETNNFELRYPIIRFDELYGYRFDIETSLFYRIENSKNSYNYGVECYNEKDIINAYAYFSEVLKEDSYYDSAQKYMKDMKEAASNEVATINVWYTNEQEKLVAEKLEEMYTRDNSENNLYRTEFKYKLVSKEEANKGFGEGENGIIFKESGNYNSEVYSKSTELLMYNKDYFDASQIKRLSNILEYDLDVYNIYIPLTNGKFIAGMLSTYEGSIYSEEVFVDGEWVSGNNYEIGISDYYISDILNYVRLLKDNPKVYTGEDGIEKFANGEIGAAIISSDEYEVLKEQMGDKLGIAILPCVTVKGIDLLDNDRQMQGVDKCKYIEFIFLDSKCEDVLGKLGASMYESEFGEYLSEEFNLYNDSLEIEYDSEDSFIDILGQQCMSNYSFVDYYDETVGKWMDKLAAFTLKATSEEEIVDYVESKTWLDR